MSHRSGLLLCCFLLIGLIPAETSKLTDHSYQEGRLNATAGELLLELMIKIAAHPTQWNKIHNLIDNINSSSMYNDEIKSQTIKEKLPYISGTALNSVSKKQKIHKPKTTWPYTHNSDNKYKIFSKMFAYQRVTGRPNFLDKNPKTYVAVSIVAPKKGKSNFEDDLSLEKELQLLKPWTHKDNLEHMASIRSRWVIRKNKDENNLFIP